MSSLADVSQAYWTFAAKHGKRQTRNYLPNDAKCDRCFRDCNNCDMTRDGVPCVPCKTKRLKCRPQTRETKRLVLPQNRSISRPITGAKQEPPCRKCFQGVWNCYLVGPAGSTCERCRRHNLACSWDLKGARSSKSICTGQARGQENSGAGETWFRTSLPGQKMLSSCVTKPRE
jgi:hypothetical protein